MKYFEVVKNALYYLYNAHRYVYCRGGQGESLADLVYKIQYYYKLKNEAEFLSKYPHPVNATMGFDCSGLVNACAMKSRNWTSTNYYSLPNQVTPIESKEGYVLVKKGHVGIDIGKGYFIHIPTEGHTVELGRISEYDWEFGAPITGVDYTGSTNN